MTTVRFSTIGMLFVLLSVPMARAADGNQRALLSSGDFTVTEQDLQQELLLLSYSERVQTLAGPDPLKKFLGQIYLGKRLAGEAERLGLEQKPVVSARLEAQRRWVLSQALREHLEEQIEPPDFAALAREYYATHRDEFQLPTQFKAAHILKKVRCDCERDEQRRWIEQLLARLQAGEDFAALAKSESEDTGSAAQGGDMGDPVRPEQVVPPFADALAKLDTGQLSGVVETEYGFHIIKLLERQSARQQSFEEVQQDLEQRLRMSYMKDQLYQRGQAYQPGPDARYDDSALEVLLRGQ
jgi:peptidyl-prolyl cis-trans isomerase C